MECFGSMLCGFLSTDSGEVLSGGPQRVLHQHLVSSCLPRIQTFLDPPSYVPGCHDMAGPLERQRLKDDETLRVPPPVTDPPQFSHQCVYEAPPNLPDRFFVSALWHDREVTPPSLPQLVLPDAAIQVCAWVPVNPVPVDFPET